MDNWTTNADGDLVESAIKIHFLEDGITDYEGVGLEFEFDVDDERSCLVLKQHDSQSPERICRALPIGLVLAGINGRIILRDQCCDSLTCLGVICAEKLNFRLKFLDTTKISISQFLEKASQSKRLDVDMYGFTRNVEYITDESKHFRAQYKEIATRDMDWVNYLKFIGGCDNLKPAGLFKPSPDLKAMCRRGIPAAFRPLIWQKISLSSHHRRAFPEGYYEDLVLRASEELSKEVWEDIEKDVDRLVRSEE